MHKLHKSNFPSKSRICFKFLSQSRKKLFQLPRKPNQKPNPFARNSGRCCMTLPFSARFRLTKPEASSHPPKARRLCALPRNKFRGRAHRKHYASPWNPQHQVDSQVLGGTGYQSPFCIEKFCDVTPKYIHTTDQKATLRKDGWMPAGSTSNRIQPCFLFSK